MKLHVDITPRVWVALALAASGLMLAVLWPTVGPDLHVLPANSLDCDAEDIASDTWLVVPKARAPQFASSWEPPAGYRLLDGTCSPESPPLFVLLDDEVDLYRDGPASQWLHRETALVRPMPATPEVKAFLEEVQQENPAVVVGPYQEVPQMIFAWPLASVPLLMSGAVVMRRDEVWMWALVPAVSAASAFAGFMVPLYGLILLALISGASGMVLAGLAAIVAAPFLFLGLVVWSMSAFFGSASRRPNFFWAAGGMLCSFLAGQISAWYM